MIKILIINYEFPPVGGGGGKVCEDICRVFARRGICSTVLTSSVKNLPRSELHDGYTIHRIPVFRRSKDRCTVPEMIAYILFSILPAMQTAYRWKPDCIHVHFAVPSGVVAWVVARTFRIPYLLTAHLGDVPGGVPMQTGLWFSLFKPFTVPIWKHASAVTAISNHTAMLAQRAYGRVNIQTITHGLDLAGFPKRKPFLQNPLHFLFVGRFSIQKNLLFLMDALNRVNDCPWRLTLAGDGPQEESIRRRINLYHLSEKVHLTGWLDQNDVGHLMQQADIFILPSTSEGFPISAMYALGYGMAFLTSNIGGLRDIVLEHYNGLFFSPDNPAGFEASFRRFLAFPELVIRMQQNSTMHSQKFDLEKKADEYLVLLRSITASNRKLS
jgi:glycosyltransferase involved in cell wall biosynthesis